MSFIDVSGAYFEAKRDPDVDPVYVDLPHEDRDKARSRVGLLLVHLCGTRAAADGWHCEHSNLLGGMGFLRGCGGPCAFRHPRKRIVCSVHGDDFIAPGPKRELDWMTMKLGQKYELTDSGRLGPGPKDDKEVKDFNRTVRWMDQEVGYDADSRHVEQIIRDLDLPGAKPVTTPGAKPTIEQACHSKPHPSEQAEEGCTWSNPGAPPKQ